MCTIAGVTWLATKNDRATDKRDIEQAREDALRSDLFSDAVASFNQDKKKKTGGLFSDTWNV